jgi:hypothetical protein
MLDGTQPDEKGSAIVHGLAESSVCEVVHTGTKHCYAN